MSWLSDLFMGKDPQLGTFQDEQRQQVYQALLPLLQRMGTAGTASSRTDPYMNRWNMGQDPIFGRSYNTNRFNLPTRSQAYPTNTRGSQQNRGMVLANINRNRIARGLQPITLDQYSSMGQTR